MIYPTSKQLVKQFVTELVAGNYEAAVGLSSQKERLQATWVKEAVQSYPGCLTLPPESAYEAIEVYEYLDGSGYMLEFFLWVNDKPSDLIIKIDVSITGAEECTTLWDILVP